MKASETASRGAAYNLAGLEEPGCGPAEKAWILEMDTMFGLRIKLHSYNLALAARARLCSVDSFLGAMEVVLTYERLLCAETRDGMCARVAWMREHVRQHGHGASPRCIVGVAAGPKCEPIVDELSRPFVALAVADAEHHQAERAARAAVTLQRGDVAPLSRSSSCGSTARS